MTDTQCGILSNSDVAFALRLDKVFSSADQEALAFI